MMDWTDRHCRAFHRALTRRARLYTEMVTVQAVRHGDRERLMGFDGREHPLALQLGGSEPRALAQAAAIGADLGYDEINLNVGCPSDRVQGGGFGACLMREPMLVADCVAAMAAVSCAPVTVKCRLGVDEQDPEVSLYTLVDACAAAGVRTFVVHARKAWLDGLSPRENRDVPPLDYALVHRLKRDRQQLTIVLNGGLPSVASAAEHLSEVDGVMLGRAAYHAPADLGSVDALVFGEGEPVSAEDALERHLPYLAEGLARGVRLASMTRHMLGLFNGRPGARAWRRVLTEGSVRPGAGLEVIDAALAQVSRRERTESQLATALTAA